MTQYENVPTVFPVPVGSTSKVLSTCSHCPSTACLASSWYGLSSIIFKTSLPQNLSALAQAAAAARL